MSTDNDMILSSENPSTITKVTMIMTPSDSPASSATAGSGVIADDCFDDGCSICLEPFNSHHPSTVTNCKHEYHLHCILEWSQRSTECPICCRLLELEDSTSQELLAAAKVERTMRSKSNIHVVHEDREIDHHFAAPTSRVHSANRSRRQTPSRLDSSEVFPSVSSENTVNLDYGLAAGLTTAVGQNHTTEPKPSPPLLPSFVNGTFDTAETKDGHVNRRIFFGQTPPDYSRKSSSSEFLAFSESVKVKLSAASARYKESITKGTRGFKEKLLARNTTVKELGRGVQREMSAGIAGVARMIERFDLSSKRTGVSVPLLSVSVEKPDLSHKEKSAEDSVAIQYPIAVSREIAHDMNSYVPPFNSSARPAQTEVSLI